MDLTLIPTKPGQIVKITSDILDLETEQVYIDDDEELVVVDLKELQRNIRNPEKAERIPVRKDQLVVVSENLNSYIQSWNDKAV
jgi:hypothetical protein